MREGKGREGGVVSGCMYALPVRDYIWDRGNADRVTVHDSADISKFAIPDGNGLRSGSLHAGYGNYMDMQPSFRLAPYIHLPVCRYFCPPTPRRVLGTGTCRYWCLVSPNGPQLHACMGWVGSSNCETSPCEWVRRSTSLPWCIVRER